MKRVGKVWLTLPFKGNFDPKKGLPAFGKKKKVYNHMYMWLHTTMPAWGWLFS